jgi:hypothetical protein
MRMFIVLCLASLGVHRLWNYEAIFQRPRQWVNGFAPLACPPCNAFWVAAAVAAAAWWTVHLPWWQAVGFPLAAYPILRTAVWLYSQPDIAQMLTLSGARASQAPSATWSGNAPVALLGTQQSGQLQHAVKPSDPSTGCTSCGEKRKAYTAERERTDVFKRRVVILAPNANVLEAAVNLAAAIAARHADALVQIWMTHGMQPIKPLLYPNTEYRFALPAVSPMAVTESITAHTENLRNLLIWLGNATIVTVDIFQDHSQDALGKAVTIVSDLPAFGWLHLTSTPPLAPYTTKAYHVSALMTDAVAALEYVLPVPMPEQPASATQPPA